jgi:hypothetical protein
MREPRRRLTFPILLLVTSLFVNGVIFGGYGCWGLIRPFNTNKPLGFRTPSHNDERDLRRRDRMHFYAYRVVVSLIVLGYFLGRDSFGHPQVGRAVLLGALILGLTLPQAPALDRAGHGVRGAGNAGVSARLKAGEES